LQSIKNHNASFPQDVFQSFLGLWLVACMQSIINIMILIKLFETLLIAVLRLGVAAGIVFMIYGFFLASNKSDAGMPEMVAGFGFVVLIICLTILNFTKANNNVAYKREMRDFGKQAYKDAIRSGHSKSSAKMQAEQAVLARHEQNLLYHARGLKEIPKNYKPRKKW